MLEYFQLQEYFQIQEYFQMQETLNIILSDFKKVSFG